LLESRFAGVFGTPAYPTAEGLQSGHPKEGVLPDRNSHSRGNRRIAHDATFADSVSILMHNGLVQGRIPDQGLKKAAMFVPYLQQTLEKPPLEAARAAFVVA
jgi:hypothetical protein